MMMATLASVALSAPQVSLIESIVHTQTLYGGMRAFRWSVQYLVLEGGQASHSTAPSLLGLPPFVAHAFHHFCTGSQSQTSLRC